MKFSYKLFFCYIFMFLLLTGCNKTEESVNSSINQPLQNQESSNSNVITEINLQDPEFLDLDCSNVLDPSTLSEEDVMNLPIEEIKKIVCVYTSDFRKVYGLDRDQELTDDDWEHIRFFLYYQLFGEEGLKHYYEDTMTNEISTVYQDLISANEINPVNVTEEDLLYLNPSSDYIASLSISEFRIWLQNASVYYASSDADYTDTDFNQISDEDIKIAQDNYVLELQKLGQ